MSVNPSPIGGYAGQFFDNNGQPLSGGKIYTYAAGTTTPQATYTSALGITPHSNPIVLDSAGRVPGGEIWLTDGLVYKFVIETSAAILIGTYDNITGVNSNFVNYTVQEEVQTATAGQTVFTLTTINYTPGTNSLSVYVDGVNQYVGTSYLETDSTTVTFTPGLHVGAEVKFTTAVQTTTGAVDANNVGYTAGFTGAVGQTVQTKLEQYVSVKDFGAVGDGVTDDTAALAAAISYQQTSGCILQLVSGKTYLVSSWTPLTLSSAFYLDGQNSTLQCANATRVAFVTCKSSVKITNTVFDGWYRVVSNPNTVTETTDNFEFIGNTCINATSGANNFAYYLLVQNPVNRVVVANNRFFDAKVAAVYIGDNVYANQDTWKNIIITDNVVDGVTITTGPSQIFGILVYGRDVFISGNSVNDVECAAGAYSSSNGAYGIYTKARYNRIIGNTVHSVGVVNNNADPDQFIGINVKGTARGVTTSPNGYSTVVEGNTVQNIGTAGTYGTGISMDHNGVVVDGNWIESGRYGVLAGDPLVASTDGIVVTSNHIVVGAGANSRGVEISTYDTHSVLSSNVINAGGSGNCIRIRSTVGVSGNSSVTGNSFRNCGVALYMSADTYNITNVSIANNLLVSGTHGVFMATSGGGAFTDIMIVDNDFSAASTAGIAGGGISATTRIRNNKGYVSENGGATGSIATGATVSHGCAITPTSVILTALGTGPTDAYVSAIGASTFTVNFGGGGSQAFAWEAKIANYFA